LLTQCIDEQDRQFANAFRVLEDAIAEQAFPAASVAVVYRGDLVALRAFGRYTYDRDSPAVTSDTIFDLASVSKVAATTNAAAILWERGKFDLDSAVPGRPELTIRSLLTHTSGLPAYGKLFEQTRDREKLLESAYATPLEAPFGSRTEYSDIGFIILGDVLEKLTGEPLDRFSQRAIFDPLGLKQTRFCPPPAWRSRCAPTRDDDYFRHKIIQGEVNDENAWVMNGVAGHAGVFSSALDVAEFAHCWLRRGSPILKPETVAEFTRQQPGTMRALGWDRPTQPSSSGQYFSPESYGHLGYTGTSLWIDPTRDLAVVLLTNRTWPDAKIQAIKQIRPRLHDAVVEAL
jgi:serine-type D-Ala-D-Ala carboxypeptidase